jgi:hypothetical protein
MITLISVYDHPGGWQHFHLKRADEPQLVNILLILTNFLTVHLMLFLIEKSIQLGNFQLNATFQRAHYVRKLGSTSNTMWQLLVLMDASHYHMSVSFQITLITEKFFTFTAVTHLLLSLLQRLKAYYCGEHLYSCDVFNNSQENGCFP